MTGYASGQQALSAQAGTDQTGQAQLALEIRSVNSRFLDLSFRLPDELRSAEPALRELLVGALKRGKVEVRGAIELTGASVVPDPSPDFLTRLQQVQAKVQHALPQARGLGVGEVLRLAGSPTSAPPQSSATLLQLAQSVLQALLRARQREGERLAQMLLDRISQLRSLADQAVPMVPRLVEQQQQKFLERWREAIALSAGGASPEAAQDRALNEATAFAIRIDVAEEITRLHAHLDELQRLIEKGGEIGKRLDFLIQELHREANTLGSKSAALELTRISVDMKVLIEQMREQVQNIE